MVPSLVHFAVGLPSTLLPLHTVLLDWKLFAPALEELVPVFRRESALVIA